MSKNFKTKLYIIGFFLSLIMVFVISLNIGYSKLSPMEALNTIIGNGSFKQNLILFQFRIPRIIISILTGVGLALSGCIIQGITRNPLADPGLIGISSGSGLMVILYVIIFDMESSLSIFILPLLSFLGAIIAAFLVYILSYKKEKGVSHIRLILMGIAVNAGISALTTILVIKLDENQFDFVASFQAGQIWGANWQSVKLILPWFCLIIPFIFVKARSLDILNLGDDIAFSLGAEVEKERRLLLIGSVALAACCVSVAGNIGFIGLVAPHLARKIVGPIHRILLPTSALVGGLLVLLSDTIGRFVIQPSEIPTGIMTAIIGAPYFIYLLAKND
ncbi:iron ABC transporter permease [Clostridiaceae bacterium M8S5]|nr:iron ABC transporter permease [Clostridiaceae bacterium M8S5]